MCDLQPAKSAAGLLGPARFGESARRLHKLNFGPRLGIAYRLGDETVLLTGYGLIWIEMAGITAPFTIPQFPFIQSGRVLRGNP
jgi:hypothetical protein